MMRLDEHLPTSITAGGRCFNIETDYRVWLRITRKIQEEELVESDFIDIFVDELPPAEYAEEITQQILDFLANPNVVPNYVGSTTDERLLDYDIDAEFIYSAFLQCYRIDLIDIDYLHWHKFKALLNSLPSNCFLKEIMSMRGYTRSSKSPDKVAQENKRAWKLPELKSSERQRLLDELDELLYNS